MNVFQVDFIRMRWLSLELFPMEWDADIVLQERSLIPQMPQERHKEIVKLARKVIKNSLFYV